MDVCEYKIGDSMADKTRVGRYDLLKETLLDHLHAPIIALDEWLQAEELTPLQFDTEHHDSLNGWATPKCDHCTRLILNHDKTAFTTYETDSDEGFSSSVCYGARLCTTCSSNLNLLKEFVYE